MPLMQIVDKKSLKSFYRYIKQNECTYQSIADTAGYHNSIYRGKDITSYFTDGSLYTRISSGTFDDLYVGDFFVAQYDGRDTIFRIAGFNVYINTGMNIFLTTFHAVIVPDGSLGKAPMNTNSTTEGGYANSTMRTVTIQGEDGIDAKLTDIFGSHLLTINESLSYQVVESTGLSSGYPVEHGCSSNSKWYSSKADLMSEVELYGAPICSSSWYDIGTACVRFPIAVFDPYFIKRGWTYWLRGVAKTSYFTCVSATGKASYDVAGLSYFVRPRFLID